MSNEDRMPVGSENGNAKRVGDAERAAAVGLLDEHWQAGRLDPGEHELRVTRAKTAVTQADIDGLFMDLPKSGRAVSSPADQTGAVSSAGTRGFLEGKRETIMALMPFAALALFFTVGGWMWFLMIPVMGILLYGADGGPNGRHGWFWGRRGR